MEIKRNIHLNRIIARKGNGAGIKVAPKWKDPISGATWTGRGKSPSWFNEVTAIKL